MGDADKITMCSASWCGFSQKFEKQIEEDGKKKHFDIVHCDKDKDHPACEGVSGYPTFKKAQTVKDKSEGSSGFEECSVGFGPTGDILKKCQ